MLRNFTRVFVGVWLISTAAPATELTPQQNKMFQYLDAVQNAFQVRYAPTEWKKKYLNWDLATEIQKAKDAVQSNRNITLREFQKIVKRFSTSMKDYHVSVTFFSTESASLPFQAISINKKYYLAYIDRTKLAQDLFPFEAGDEIVQFGDRSTADAVADIRKELGDISNDTDEALATLRLTGRGAMVGMDVPRGPIRIGIRPKGSDTVRYRQLTWEHHAEQITEPRAAKASPGLRRMMVSPTALSVDKISAANPFAIGGRTSYVPVLGKKIWESAESNPFHAYIYQTPDRHLVGYLRISSYIGGTEQAAAFAEIIQKFQGTVDGLVLDEINNPGGSVIYLYALASMLSDQDLFTPRHHMAITQSDIADAVKSIGPIEAIKTDEEAKKAFGNVLEGYPVTYQLTRFFVDYYRFVIHEGNAGRYLTDPHFLMGVDRINPHPTVRFTKPIVLLTNNLDFSGGDFFPAILQDNKRVTILGTRTAGAGGYVSPFPIENQLGINQFSITGSLAERIDQNPIENLGITPDIQYAVTEADLQNHFADYGKAINAAIAQFLK